MKERERERKKKKKKKKGKTVLDPINSFIKVAGFNCVSKYQQQNLKIKLRKKSI